MTRLKAFSIHLAISAGIATSVVAIMLLLWYAPPFFSALGGKIVLMILVGVDVTLGPLITLIIFNPRKTRRALTFDLTVIAILQTAALTYGMSVVFEARPVFAVFSRDSFDLVTANMLSKEDIARAKDPDYRSLPLTGPVYVYSELPTDIRERNQLISSMMAGKDLPQFPQYYMPYDEHGAVAARAAKSIAELKQLNPRRSGDIDGLIRKSGLAEADTGYLPLRARFHDQAVLVEKSSGKILGQLDVNPWPRTATFSQGGK
ncbi:MAG TPA: TfpX/TfpZ family type IV pilin accessory protein [Gallionella sp.]|nr:TfpX/TfpZ family type IV pilin accessory protein [Gallionella sp.]